MPRFQSWLFNSIDRSLPVQLGRRARFACQQLVARIVQPGFASLPAAWEHVGKGVARAVLYPVYLIAIATKRSFPQLNSAAKSAQATPPLLLRPFQQLIVWAEASEIFADDRASNQQSFVAKDASGMTNSSLGKASPQAPQPQHRHLEQSDRIDQINQIDQSASKPVSNQYEQNLERIRRLIQAAIAYFFGKKKTNISPVEDSEVIADACEPNRQLPSPKVAESKLNSISLQGIASPEVSQPNRHLGKGASRLISTQYEQHLERIRRLIQAAIAYFFGKKPNVSTLETMEVRSQPWLTMEDLFDDDSCHWPAINHTESAQRVVSPWESPQLGDINSAQARSLNAVPNRSLVRSPDRALTKKKHSGIITTTSSNPLASGLTHKSEHSSSEIIPDLSCWLEDSLDIELEEQSRPLQAWIETQATFLGYVYSPILKFIYCIDSLVAKFEQWLIKLWQKIRDKLRGDI
jgi:hypothetical protein